MPKKLRPIATKHRSSSENDAVAKITGWVADFKPRLSSLKKRIDANVRQTKIARALPASASTFRQAPRAARQCQALQEEADLLRREFRRLTGAIRTFQATARAKAKTDILLSEASAIARDANCRAIDFRGEPSTDRERVIRAEMLRNAEGGEYQAWARCHRGCAVCAAADRSGRRRRRCSCSHGLGPERCHREGNGWFHRLSRARTPRRNPSAL